MPRAQRTQYDDLQQDYSKKGGLDCSDSVDTARQEFKDEADINKMLARFGVNTPSRTDPQFGEVDFTADLQSALNAIADAKRAHADLPAEVKKDFPTWQRLLNALERREIRLVADEKRPIEPVEDEKKD